jgi:poly-beta-1,6-N-acetyl-D-glucosamine synthase
MKWRSLLSATFLLALLAASSGLAWFGATEAIESGSVVTPQVGLMTLIWFLSLVVIVVRYLGMLGLATVDLWLELGSRNDNRLELRDQIDYPFVSVIMPVFNEGPVIRASLSSLLALDYPHFEVIVVDDGSSDQSYAKAVLLGLKNPNLNVRVLSKPNGGKADALNHGLAHAHGEIVVCVDGDGVVDSQALTHLVRHFSDPNVGAVAGNVRVANYKGFWSGMQALEYVQGYGLLKRAQNAAHVVLVVPGPLGAFRKQAIANVGAYESDTFAEDYDLTVKLLGAGWHVLYEPAAQVFTEAPESLADLIKQRYRWTRGSLQVALKRKAALFNWKARPLSSLGVWYLWFDNLIWPGVNILALIIFVVGGFRFGLHELLVYWWLQILVLDMAASAFCVAIERERLALLWWTVPYRLVYQTVMDVTRVLSTIEQFMGVEMGWGTLKRLKRI